MSEKGPRVDTFNHVEHLSLDELIETAKMRLGINPGGHYTAGTDQWLVWEAIYNLARAMKESRGPTKRPESEVWAIPGRDDNDGTIPTSLLPSDRRAVLQVLGVTTFRDLENLQRRAEAEWDQMVKDGRVVRIMHPFGELVIIRGPIFTEVRVKT